MKINLIILGVASAKNLASIGHATVNTPACIGCDNAEAGQFPWQVSLQISKSHFSINSQLT